jgi:hypothetical protein
MSTAFSAIITAGALVLPDTSVGMAEQSITRSPRRRARAAAHRPPPGRPAHLAGAAGMEDGGAVVAAELEQRGVVAGLGAGLDLALARRAASPAWPRWRRAAFTPATAVRRSSSVDR